MLSMPSVMAASVVVLLTFVPTRAAGGESPVSLPRTIITLTYVKDDSPAANVGLRRGDVLVSLDGRPIKRVSGDSLFASRATDFGRYFNGPARPGGGDAVDRKARLDVIRDDRLVSLDVPGNAEPAKWDMDVFCMRNFLSRVDVSHPGGGEWRERAEASLRHAARLDWPEAVQAAKSAVKTAPADEYLYSHLGMCLFRIPDYAGAEKAYLRALEIESNHGDALLGCARVYALTARPAEARSFLERLLLVQRLGTLDDGVRALAERQLPLVARAGADEKRADLAGRQTRMLPLQTEEVFKGMPVELSCEYDCMSRLSLVELSDFSLACTVGGLETVGNSSYLRHARVSFQHAYGEGGFGAGIARDGSALIAWGTVILRLPSMHCVKPPSEANRVLLVRRGHMLECRINDAVVSQTLVPDLPMFFNFFVLSARATFTDLCVEVPAGPDLGDGAEEVF